MSDLDRFANGVDIATSIAIVASVIFYFAFRKDIKESMTKANKKK